MRRFLGVAILLLLLPAAAYDQAPVSQAWLERGQLLRRVRVGFGLTQAAWAARIGGGMTDLRVSKFERGIDTLTLADRRRVFTAVRNLLADSVSNRAGDWFYVGYRDAMPRNPR